MVTPISEEEARAVLRAMQAPGADETTHGATRRTGGWSFAWRRELGNVPVGTPRWIVADNGRARMLRRRELADEAIADELAS